MSEQEKEKLKTDLQFMRESKREEKKTAGERDEREEEGVVVEELRREISQNVIRISAMREELSRAKDVSMKYGGFLQCIPCIYDCAFIYLHSSLYRIYIVCLFA